MNNEWQNVFDAHPDANEIFVGTNAAGEQQPFLTHGHAVNFAGSPERVEAVPRFPEAAAPAAKKAKDKAAPAATEDAE